MKKKYVAAATIGITVVLATALAIVLRTNLQDIQQEDPDGAQQAYAGIPVPQSIPGIALSESPIAQELKLFEQAVLGGDADKLAQLVAEDFSFPGGDKSSFIESMTHAYVLEQLPAQLDYSKASARVAGGKVYVVGLVPEGSGVLPSTITLLYEKRGEAWLLTGLDPEE